MAAGVGRSGRGRDKTLLPWQAFVSTGKTNEKGKRLLPTSHPHIRSRGDPFPQAGMWDLMAKNFSDILRRQPDPRAPSPGVPQRLQDRHRVEGHRRSIPVASKMASKTKNGRTLRSEKPLVLDSIRLVPVSAPRSCNCLLPSGIGIHRDWHRK